MVLGYFHTGPSLTYDKIAVLSKEFVLQCFHRNIRLWFIDNRLPQKFLEDPDIIPYYTPCHGHIDESKRNTITLSSDAIDGVLKMQAYCQQCREDLKTIAVNIKRIDVPALVELGTESVVLDCEYSAPALLPGLVLKWFFNGAAGLVYQWIPPMRPQVIGLLKGKVDLTFRISDEPLQAYRAIKILKPSTHLSGNYTCVVSTFEQEDHKTRTMLVYSPGKSFHFVQEKKYVFLVTLTCAAEYLYPKPTMTILSKSGPLKQLETTTEMDSWGMYSMTSQVVVHDDEVARPWEEFVCLLTIPPANYTANRTTVYYPGLMPTAYSAAIEIAKPKERHTNKCRAVKEDLRTIFFSVLLFTNSFLKVSKFI